MLMVLGLAAVPWHVAHAKTQESAPVAKAKSTPKASSNPVAKSAAKASQKPAPKARSRVAASGSRLDARSTTGKGARVAGPAARQAKAGPGLRAGAKNSRRSVVRLAPPKPSFGELYGLRATEDELDLRSSVALVVDQDTNEVLFSKNSEAVLPIASITKLMTALVVAEAKLPMDELLTVGQDDVEATVGSPSRLRLGTQLTRAEMLHLSLMASENRAAHVLGRTYPGGMQRFVSAMNGKAQLLGMSGTRYVEPTGLSPSNQSSAKDLTQLVRAAFLHPMIRELSTSLEMVVPMGDKSVQFRNTNGLVRNPDWEIGLQKTGYIAAAGRCVVMQAQMAGRQLIMVLLDSAGRYSRIGDAERLRKWLAAAHEASSVLPVSGLLKPTASAYPPR
jgi:D-alanyl-D-alanine endopeptidase (penicillin-binding protein 7)